jgi:hypothetical protein
MYLISILFNDAVCISDYIYLMSNDWIVKNKLEKRWKERAVA